MDGLEARDDLQAVDLGYVEIQDHHVGGELPHDLDGGLAVVCLQDMRDAQHLRQVRLEYDTHWGVVVDDQDCGHSLNSIANALVSGRAGTQRGVTALCSAFAPEGTRIFRGALRFFPNTPSSAGRQSMQQFLNGPKCRCAGNRYIRFGNFHANFRYVLISGRDRAHRVRTPASAAPAAPRTLPVFHRWLSIVGCPSLFAAPLA